MKFLRKALNKSIDLLHEVSRGKSTKKDAKKELSICLSHYLLSSNSNNEIINNNQKIKLNHILEKAYEIIDKIESKSISICDGIMLMSEIIINNQLISINQEPEDETQIEKDITIDVKKNNRTENQKEIGELAGDVVGYKSKLDDSILKLNDSLLILGFVIKPI